MTEHNPLVRPLGASVAVGAIAAVWVVWGQLHSHAQMGALDLGSGRSNFAITLNFAPESFHVTRLQAIGRVVEVRDHSVFMMDVDNDDMRDFAKNYWVREVVKWKGL